MSFQPYRNTVKRSIMKIYIVEFKSKLRHTWMNVKAFYEEKDAEAYIKESKNMDSKMELESWVYRIEQLTLS